MSKRLSLLLIAILSTILFVGCISQGIPSPEGYVNDFANMIPDEEEKSLESFLVAYEQKTTNEVAVVTVETIGDKTIEDYTIHLAEKWKVGKKEKDNGVILLIAEKERKIRIEVGYGLEPVLTDAKAKLIIEREMTPLFKAGDYAAGIRAGANAVVAALEGTYVPSTSSSSEGEGWPTWLIIVVIVGVFLLLLLLLAFLGEGEGGGFWSSGGSSGGSGSGGGGFGGGGFGGGGASGGW